METREKKKSKDETVKKKVGNIVEEEASSLEVINLGNSINSLSKKIKIDELDQKEQINSFRIEDKSKKDKKSKILKKISSNEADDRDISLITYKLLVFVLVFNLFAMIVAVILQNYEKNFGCKFG